MNNIIKNLESISLSNVNVSDLLDHKVNIILYPDLQNYQSIDEMLDPYNCCIVLYHPPHGHWCALIRTTDSSIEFFNPYGGLPDEGLKNTPYLKQLMYKSPYELNYNEFQFQKKGYNINTCGRHCIIRVFYRLLDIYQYKNLLDHLCKMTNTDYDGLVTLLTSSIDS